MGFVKQNTASMDSERAEAIAIDALAFLADDAERLRRFAVTTGVDLGSLRDQAGSVSFLAAVLDHLLGDESLLLVFAGHTGHDPAAIAPARRALMPPRSGEDR